MTFKDFLEFREKIKIVHIRQIESLRIENNSNFRRLARLEAKMWKKIENEINFKEIKR